MPPRAAWSVLLVSCLVAPLPAAAPPPRLNAEQQARFEQIGKVNDEVNRLFRKQQFPAALPLAEKTLGLSLGLFGPNNRYVAIHRVNLATVQQQLGDLDKALTHMKEAVRIHRWLWLEDEPTYVPCLSTLALIYQQKDQYSLSLPIAEEALDRALRARPNPNRETGILIALNNLAVLHRMRGEPRRALPMLRQVVERLEARKAKPDLSASIFLTNLGMVYHEVGETRLALATFDKTLRVLETLQATKSHSYAQAVNNLASIYRDIGDHRRAMSLWEQALPIFSRLLKPTHSAPATVHNNIASMHEQLGQYREAAESYRKAEDLRARHRPADDVERARYLQGFAVLALKGGDADKAEKLFHQALRLREKAQGPTHPEYAKNLLHLAQTHEARGDFARAAALHDQAARAYLRSTGERNLEHAQCLYNLARAMQAQGLRAAALLVAERALTSAHAYVDETAFALSDRQRQQALKLGMGVLEVYLGLGADLAPASTLYGWVTAIKALAIGRPAEEGLGRDRPELASLLGELRDTRALLGRHMQQVPTARAGQATWKQRFDLLERRKEQLQAKLGQSSFEYTKVRARPTASAVAAAIPAGAVLVEFFLYNHHLDPRKGSPGWHQERRLAAFVLPRDGDTVLVPLGQADPIEQAVRRWRKSAMSEAGPDEADAALLRRAVWEPVEKHLGPARTVLVAPSGELAGLPFAALPGNEPGRYLLERYTFGYLTSGRQLLTQTREPPKVKASGLLTLGGPEFGPVAKGGPPARPASWEPLPGTEFEVREVASQFAARFPEEPRSSLLGPNADRGRLLKALGSGHRWRHLHLGTHGYFEEVPPWRDPARHPQLEAARPAIGGLVGPAGERVATAEAERRGRGAGDPSDAVSQPPARLRPGARRGQSER